MTEEKRWLGITFVILVAIVPGILCQSEEGESCVNTAECNTTARLQCLEGTCQCPSGPIPSDGNCKKLVGESCDQDSWDCAYKLGLECLNNQCNCADTTFCLKTFSQTCNDKAPCDNSTGLKCLSGTCDCPPPQQLQKGVCGKRYNENCNEGECADTLSLKCLNGKCQCKNGWDYTNEGERCYKFGKLYGDGCMWGQCYQPHGLSCVDNVCQCLSGSRDPTTDVCKKLTNDACMDTTECAHLLECVDGKCSCPDGETCKKGVWETCSNTAECDNSMGLNCVTYADRNPVEQLCVCPSDNTFNNNVCKGNSVGSSCESGQCLRNLVCTDSGCQYQ